VNLVSAQAFDWFCTGATASLAGAWVLYDLRNLAKALRADRADPLVRDRLFGYVIGVIIGGVGVAGVIQHYG
jgi:hypothetical protein